jgi:PAS domain S-box-containing protein
LVKDPLYNIFRGNSLYNHMEQNSLSIFLNLLPILISLTVSAGVSVYLASKRYVTGARSFALIIILETLWTLGLLFELLTPSLDGKLTWDNLQWIPSLLVPLAQLSFAIRYTGRPTLRPKTWIGLGLVPLVSLLLILTNRFHHLASSAAWLIPGSPFSELTYSFGPVMLLCIIYGYAMSIAALTILARFAARQNRTQRRQTIITFIGLIIPFAGAVISILGIHIGPQRDFSPYYFIITNVILAYGFSRFRVFELAPLARNVLIDSMEDGEIVLDPTGRLVDINPAAKAIIGQPGLRELGQVFRSLAGAWFIQVNLDPDQRSQSQEIEISARTFDLRITRLGNNQGEHCGYLLFLHDISEQKQAKAHIELAYSQVQQLVAERTIELSSALSHLEAEILERKQVDETLQRQFQRSETLVELSAKLLEMSPDYNQVIQLAVQRCVERIGDGASMFLYHPNEQALELVAAHNLDPVKNSFFWEYMHRYPILADEAGYKKVIYSHQPLLLPIVDMEKVLANASEERKEFFLRLPIYSAMFVPLLMEGTCIGVMGSVRHHPDQPQYTSEDLNFFQQAADLSAIALWNSRMVDRLKHELVQKEEAQKHLRESDEKYRSLFANSGDAILVIENDQITDCNDAALRLFSASREKLLGMCPQELSPEIQSDGESSAVKSARMIEAAIRDGYIRFEWTHCRMDGEPVETEIILDKAGLHGNNILQATIRDMTLRKRAEEEVKLAYEATLEGWAQALELRELETAHHSDRVVELTLILARKMGFREEECVSIRQGARLHDIGKMGIPDSILLRSGPLNEAEWEIMRQHPQYAYNLLSKIPYLRPALDIPYAHHERWDGTGYPRQLRGKEIPLAARIFAVVDVWDALTSDRPYRKAWSGDAVKCYLLKNSGILFDPDVVAVFLQLNPLTVDCKSIRVPV